MQFGLIGNEYEKQGFLDQIRFRSVAELACYLVTGC